MTALTGVDSAPASTATPRSLAVAQVAAICGAFGAEERAPAVEAAAAILMEGWGAIPFDRSEHRSSISIDGSPFELSIAFEPNGVALRGLFAPPSPGPRELWASGLETNARLRNAYGVALHHFELAKGPFAPDDRSTSNFSLWHAFSHEPDGRLLFKVYLNPRISGTGDAPERIREGLERLGRPGAWELVARELARGDGTIEPSFVSLDLLDGADARVKVYLEHRSAQPQEIERVLAYSPDHVAGDADRLLRALAGPGERYGRQLPMTCLAFAGADSERPRSVTLQFPVWAHVRDDEVALARLLALVPAEHRGPLERAARAVARRELADGVGLIQWIAGRRSGSSLRFTCYFAAEAHTVWPARRVAGAIDPVVDPPVERRPGGAIRRRKDAHLDLCENEDVEPTESSTLLECVTLVHCALPELALADLDTSTTWFGKRLELPFLITGMTGGTDRAAKVNRELAALAGRAGVAFGVGSQRAMSQDRTLTHTYAVRELLPDTVLLGNIGAQQARELGIDGVRDLMERIEADAIAIHLNVAQELAQPEGDRNFRDFAATIAALVAGLDGRVVVKETGCGISPAVAELLARGGVRNIDISGAGGTSWVRVEELRADPASARIAATYAGWGIPTAAATAAVRSAVGPETTLIASGGLRSGLDVAKVLALGANLAGAALPILRALADGGPGAAEAALERIATEFRHAMLLTGSSTIAQLHRCRRVVRSPLSDWVEAL